ncbi:MAG: hypothetical protein ABEI86_09055 [Halobacteriaceae archaeon]
MEPKVAIETLINELNNRIPPPVHTGGIEDTRPVPAVIIENINLEDQNYHNTDHAGSRTDSSGNVTERVFRHYYNMRFSLQVRNQDEVDAWSDLGALKRAIENLGKHPQRNFHADVNDIRSLSSGPISYEYKEPTETELSQSLLIETFYETTDSNFDVIKQFDDSINIY